MSDEIHVTFPGGKRVDALVGAHLVRTDQPIGAGGEGNAPGPFDLFAASLASCAGFYVLSFCQARGLATEGLRLRQKLRFDAARTLSSIDIEIDVPATFPEKYLDALVRAAEGCTAKRAIEARPAFVVRARRSPSDRSAATP